MRAIRLMRYESLPSLEEIPKPTIEKPSEVIVRIGGAGVCRTDLHIMEGQFKKVFPKTTLPFTLGHENAGWVEEVGSAVKGFSVGEPVVLYSSATCGICPNCRYGKDMYCQDSRSTGLDGTNGGFAEYVRTVDRCLIRVPKSSNMEELAPLADAGITVYHAVKKVLPLLTSGSCVVAFGVGGLGHIGIQLLKTLTPATVIAIDVSEDRLNLARKLGADYVVTSDPSKAPAEVRELCGGSGADFVIDFVGDGTTPAQALAMLKRGGVYSVVGYGGQLNTTTHEIITKELSIIGNLVGNYNDLRELTELYNKGKIKVITKSYGLEEAPEVMQLLNQGAITGRAVLVP